MVTRQHVLEAAHTALAIWGYQDPQLVHDLSSGRLAPGAIHSSHWYLQFRARKRRETLAPTYICLIVQEYSGGFLVRDHEESSAEDP
jgi:hypothetical protein